MTEEDKVQAAGSSERWRRGGDSIWDRILGGGADGSIRCCSFVSVQMLIGICFDTMAGGLNGLVDLSGAVLFFFCY